MMNKKLFTPLMLVMLIGLTGCTASSPKHNVDDERFEEQKVTEPVYWDLEKIDTQKLWNDQKKSDSPEVNNAPEEENVYTNVLTEETVGFSNPSNGCYMSGSNYFTELFKQNFGDSFNSKEILFNQTYREVEPISNVKLQKSNDVTYVVGDYSTPENIHHRTAVRVFSSPVNIPDYVTYNENGEEEKPEVPVQGLPTVQIDLSCSNKDDITDAMWDDMFNRYVLKFNKS